MTKAVRAAEVEALIREIQRYLACLDAIRGRPPEPQTKEQGGRDDA